MEFMYFIRYGLMSRVGRFVSDTPGLERGRSVVIQSHRGVELGEILFEVTPSQESPTLPSEAVSAKVLRAARTEDLEYARTVELDRPRRFGICEQVFRNGIWPLDMIDVEPLLEERRTVIHYLGPHHLDVEGLRAVFHSRYGLDVILEPAGKDGPALQEETVDDDSTQGCGHCSAETGSCHSETGCHSGSDSMSGGCNDCGIKKLISTRQKAS